MAGAVTHYDCFAERASAAMGQFAGYQKCSGEVTGGEVWSKGKAARSCQGSKGAKDESKGEERRICICAFWTSSD